MNIYCMFYIVVLFIYSLLLYLLYYIWYIFYIFLVSDLTLNFERNFIVQLKYFSTKIRGDIECFTLIISHLKYINTLKLNCAKHNTLVCSKLINNKVTHIK